MGSALDKVLNTTLLDKLSCKILGVVAVFLKNLHELSKQKIVAVLEQILNQGAGFLLRFTFTYNPRVWNKVEKSVHRGQD